MPETPAPVAPQPHPLDAWLGASYAIRMAVAAAITVVISEAFDIKYGFWVTITAVIVLQPDLSGTRGRSLSRIVGTLVGAVVGSLFAWVLPYNALTVGLCILLTTLISWSVRRLREPIPMAAVTAVIVFYFSRQEASLWVGLLRCLEILAGVAIGLIIAAVPVPLPRWAERRETSPERSPARRSTPPPPNTGPPVD